MKREPGPQAIGEILSAFLQQGGLAQKLKHLEIYDAWGQVVGPAILPHTRIAGFAQNKLYVQVDSAAHMQELQTFYKKQILQALQARVPRVRILDIVFRPAAPQDNRR